MMHEELRVIMAPPPLKAVRKPVPATLKARLTNRRVPLQKIEEEMQYVAPQGGATNALQSESSP